MHFNQKDLRIIKLAEKGLDESIIARKVGYNGNFLEKGVARVREALRRYKEQSLTKQ